MQDGGGEYDVDAKEFSAHSDKVVFIRRVPAWISTEELGRQVNVDNVDDCDHVDGITLALPHPAARFSFPFFLVCFVSFLYERLDNARVQFFLWCFDITVV